MRTSHLPVVIMEETAPAVTERFLAAVVVAEEVHGRRRRTGTEIPYMAHLLVVTGLGLEDGGDEDEAIAAMLHDSVEDGGGRVLLARISRSFGPRVAAIVEACSDWRRWSHATNRSPKAPADRRSANGARSRWRGRTTA